jgi:hypothetical protein
MVKGFRSPDHGFAETVHGGLSSRGCGTGNGDDGAGGLRLHGPGLRPGQGVGSTTPSRPTARWVTAHRHPRRCSGLGRGMRTCWLDQHRDWYDKLPQVNSPGHAPRFHEAGLPRSRPADGRGSRCQEMSQISGTSHVR